MRKSRAPFAEIFVLGEHECWWRDRYLFFESRGFRLRSRLHPDWIPSWETARRKLHPAACEDATSQSRAVIVDATRIADGKMVYLKRLRRDGSEKSIALFLSSEELRKDPQNHCVPVYEYFDDPFDESLGFIVMPLLRHFDSPPLLYVGDVIEFVRQTLVGLSFMHRHGIAHRDCSDLNIMLDASNMYPDGFHPIHQTFALSWKSSARYWERHEVESVKYYFIDFGISSHFTDPNQPRLVLGTRCQDHEVPELSNLILYDPFAVDIFILGNVYRNNFTKELPSLFFLRPLADAMTSDDPESRPNIQEALEQFEKIIEELPKEEARQELYPPPPVQPSMHSRFVKSVSLVHRRMRDIIVKRVLFIRSA